MKFDDETTGVLIGGYLSKDAAREDYEAVLASGYLYAGCRPDRELVSWPDRRPSASVRRQSRDGAPMTGPAETGRHGRVRRVRGVIRLPPPVEDALFPSRAQAAFYLGAWGLTVTHFILWLLIAIGFLTSEALVVGVSLLSAAATCLFVVMVIAAHRRLQIYRGSTARHIAAVWWRGPWDPVGRLIWLPVRLPAAWQALRHPPSPPRQPGPGRDGTGDPGRGASRQASP
jgi:hypothetical protein